MSRIVVEFIFRWFYSPKHRGSLIPTLSGASGQRLVAALLGLGFLAVHRKEAWRAGCLARQDAWAAGPGTRAASTVGRSRRRITVCPRGSQLHP